MIERELLCSLFFFTNYIMKKDIEIRSNIELRALEGEKNTIHGFIPYNSNSEGLPWVERLARGCFTKTLQESRDILALYDHATGNLLARTSNGSLRFNDTDAGLEFDIDLPETQLGKDSYEMVRSGLIGGCSFGFTTVQDEWTYENNQETRVILEARLYEVSLVAQPAYPQTNVAARSLSSMFEGKEITEDEEKSIQAEIDKLQALLPHKEEEQKEEPQPESEPEPQPEQEEDDSAEIEALYERLKVAEETIKQLEG